MANFRIIPRLEIKSKSLIKGMRMEGLKKFDNLFKRIDNYQKDNADEFFYDDIVASLYSREIDFNFVKRIANLINIPLTVGGGVRALKDIEKLFNVGADKISINSALFNRPKLLEQASIRFGSQSILIQAQTKKINNQYYVFYNSGREYSQILLNDWIKRTIDLGVGEIAIISIDFDGMTNGVDIQLLNYADLYNVSFLYGGGVVNKEDINILKKFNFQGALISAALHKNFTTVKKLKK